MKFFAPAFVAALGFASAVEANTYGPLVTPAELAASIDDVQPILVDIRNDGYAEAHVDGALWAPYRMFRGPAENPGALVDLTALEGNLEQLGLEYDLPIVIITEGKTDTDFGAAARVYWTLKSTGFTDLSILNGGQAAWAAAGFPINATVESSIPSDLDLTFSHEWLAETSDVEAVTTGAAQAILVDARPEDFYLGRKGHDAADRPGTLPGAVNYVYTSFFDDGAAAIRGASNVDELKVALGVEEGKDIVSFCNTGHWAATNWFALSELAELENVKLYAGSMVEYSNAGLPMENTPGLFRNLLNQIGF